MILRFTRTRRLTANFILVLGLIFTSAEVSWGQYSITGTGSGNTFTETFDAFRGTALTLPSNWTVATASYNTGTPIITSGAATPTVATAAGNNCYAARASSSSSDYAIVQKQATSGSSTTFTFSTKNNTGSTINGFVISWNVEQYNLASRATTVDFSYRLNGGGYVTTGITGTTLYTSSTGSSTTFSVVQTSRSITITGLSLAALGTADFMFTVANGVTSGNNAHVGIDDFSVYATVAVPSYTVTYDGNTSTGGSVPTDPSSPYLSGSNVTVLGNTGPLTKTGYTFVEWNTQANGLGTSYAPGSTLSAIGANTILYAQWTPATTPTLASSSLTSFGSQCIANTYGPNQFTITGAALTAANVTVSSLSGFTFSTTSGGTYTSSLSLTQPGGTYSQDIYVKFNPVAVTTYDGNISIGGGGASSITVAATGSGISTSPTVTTTAASAISTIDASSGGSAISVGCGTITAKGVVWGLTANPTTGSNLGMTSDGSGTATYASAITGLSANTTYNYRAYVTNSNGVTSYGANLTFTTLKGEPTNFPTSFSCGTTTATTIPLTWTDAAGGQLPDGYLIKWSGTSYAAITAPADGTAEADASTVKNIAQGVGAYTATGLVSGTTYYFKIWSYTNSGSSINYKLVGEPQTSCATILAPTALYLHNFNDTPGTSPYNTSPTATTGTPTGILNTNLNTSSWVSSNGAFTSFAGASGQALVIQPANGSTSSMTLTFNVASGYKCSITGFDFWRQRSSNGPSSITSITINGTTVGTSITVPTSGSAVGNTNVSNAVDNMTGTITVVLNLSAPTGATQNIRLDEFTLYGFISPVCTPPGSQATNFATSAVSTNSATISWTNGTGDKRIVVVKETTTVAGNPVSGTAYTSDATFGAGNTIAVNEYVVYAGNGSSVTITGLNCGKTYHVKIFEYDDAGNCYLTTSPLTSNFTTLTPAISASVPSLSGFNYSTVTGGPSGSQSYTISASNLNPAAGNINITAPTNFEVSTDNSTFNNSLSVPYSAGTLGTSTIYVRLKTGLSGGPYSGNISNTYAASPVACAASANVAVSGTVSEPVITVGAVTAFGNQCVNTSSAAKSYTVSGVNLTNDITITAPAGYEISISSGSGYGSSLVLNQVAGTVSSTTIYVRFSPVSATAYSGNITHVSTDAVTKNVSLTGTGLAPVTPTVSIASNPAATICDGNSVTFTATPANLGGGTASYQWKSNGTDIPGQTTNTYTSTTLTNGQVITCVMTISGGCVSSTSATSSGITMVVNSLPANPSNPSAAANPACGSTTLNTIAAPVGESYYWQGTASSGTSTANNASSTYAVSSTGTYYVRSRNTAGCWSAGSGSVLVTINTGVSITTHPVNQSVSVGGSATFSVTAANAVSYQWQENTGSGFTNIPSATGATYTVSSATLAMTGYKYQVIVYGNAPCTSVTSNPGTLTVAAISYAAGDYRTSPNYTAGTVFFNSTNPVGGISPWQRWNGSAWVDVAHATGSPNCPENLATKPNTIYVGGGSVTFVDAAAGATYNNIIIQFDDPSSVLYSGNVSIGITIASGKNLEIKSGFFDVAGRLELQGTSNLTVRSHSYLWFDPAFAGIFVRDANSTFEVEDNATVEIGKFMTNHSTTGIWNGTEIFHPESLFYVTKWDRTENFFNASNSISTSTSAGYSAMFGHLWFDIGNSGLTGNWTGVFPTGTVNLTHKDFTIDNNNTNNISLWNAGASSFTIGRDLLTSGSSNIQVKTGGGACVTTVKRNFTHAGAGSFRLHLYSSAIADSAVLYVNGDMKITNGTFEMQGTSASTSPTRVWLAGSLTKSASAYMSWNPNGTGYLNDAFNFSGSGAIQLVDVLPHASSDMLRYRFFVKNNAYVQIKNQDWKVSTNSKLTVEDGGTLDFGWSPSNVPLKLLVNNGQSTTAFELQSGGTLVLTSEDTQGALTVAGIAYGNVQTEVRTYHPTSGSYVFKGLTNQYYKTASSGAVPVKGKNLVIDNGTKTVFFDDNFTAWNSLQMKGGNISIASTKTLELGENTTNKGILNYNSGYVLGIMKRWFNGAYLTSDDSRDLFPFGFNDGGIKNRFAKIQFTGGTPAGALTGYFVGSPMGDQTIPILVGSTNSAPDISFDITSTEDQGYWDISAVPGTFSPSEIYKATLFGQGFTTITDVSKLVLLKRTNAAVDWSVPGTSGTGLTNTDYNATPIPIVQRSGISLFSHFGFGGADANPLPVELISFSATCSPDGVSIKWSTASEKNSDYFALEVSKDLKNWSTVTQLQSSGNSSQVRHYEFLDNNKSRGTFYYRLAQVDLNGIRKIYDPASMNCSGDEETLLVVYPNPSTGAFTVEWSGNNFSGDVELRLTSATGALIGGRKVEATSGTNLVQFDKELAPGMYYITVKDKTSNSETLKLIVR